MTERSQFDPDDYYPKPPQRSLKTPKRVYLLLFGILALFVMSVALVLLGYNNVGPLSGVFYHWAESEKSLYRINFMDIFSLLLLCEILGLGYYVFFSPRTHRIGEFIKRLNGGIFLVLLLFLMFRGGLEWADHVLFQSKVPIHNAIAPIVQMHRSSKGAFCVITFRYNHIDYTLDQEVSERCVDGQVKQIIFDGSLSQYGILIDEVHFN